MASTSPPLAPAPEVTTVAWPAQDDLRRWLADRSQPRLLVVAPGARPPRVIDELEDWVREPADPDDLESRVEDLARRARDRVRSTPELDDDGLLRHEGRWVAVPEGQLEVVRLLLHRLGRLVPSDALREAYERGGGSAHPSSMRTLIVRLTRRVGEVGLRLETVRGRGVILDVVPRG